MEKQKIKNVKDLNKIVNDSKIKALIFDFDGVIADLLVDYNSLRKELSKYFLYQYNFKNNFYPLHPNLVLLKKKLGRGALYEAYTIIEKYEMEHLSGIRPNKEIINFIQNNRHKKIAVFSMNMHHTIEKFLIKKRLSKYIDLIIAKDDVVKYKPHPEGLYQILKKIRLSKKATIFIGNKEIDLETGKSAGIKTLLVKQHD